MDLFSIVLIVAEIVFVLCVSAYSQWIQKRKSPNPEPVSIPFFSLTGILGLFRVVVNYFLGLKNCRRWDIVRLMWLWTLCLVGIVLSPALIGFASPSQPVQSTIASSSLALFTSGIVYFTYRFFHAGHIVEQMWEMPSGDTVTGVVNLGQSAIPHLLEVVEVGDVDAVTAAADALSKIGAVGVVRETLQALTTHSDMLVRRTAARGLGEAIIDQKDEGHN